MSHWTYEQFKPADELCQGDIIARDPLLGVLKEVHEHFCDPKYLAFIVLTQTCDLVVHKASGCKARHIALAVVRPLAAVLPDVLEEICNSPRPGVFDMGRREEAEQFLHRVLNQNEQAHGWLYLHPDLDAGVGEPAVALLRVSIALRAREHYSLLQNARMGRLQSEYRNKLGWLKGNLYSRVPTADWSEQKGGEEQESRIIKELLDAPVDGYASRWVPATLLEAAKRKNVDLKQTPPDQIDRVLLEHAPRPPLETAVAEAKRVVNLLATGFDEQPVEDFSRRVEADCTLPALCSREITSALIAATGNAGRTADWHFTGLISTDAYLREAIATALAAAAKAFLARRGKRRDVHEFVEGLGGTRLLTASAVERVELWAEHCYGPLNEQHRESARLSLAAIQCPSRLVEHLRSLAASSIQESLAERLGKRLANSGPFQGAVKPVT